MFSRHIMSRTKSFAPSIWKVIFKIFLNLHENPIPTTINAINCNEIRSNNTWRRRNDFFPYTYVQKLRMNTKGIERTVTARTNALSICYHFKLRSIATQHRADMATYPLYYDWIPSLVNNFVNNGARILRFTACQWCRYRYAEQQCDVVYHPAKVRKCEHPATALVIINNTAPKKTGKCGMVRKY